MTRNLSTVVRQLIYISVRHSDVSCILVFIKEENCCRLFIGVYQENNCQFVGVYQENNCQLFIGVYQGNNCQLFVGVYQENNCQLFIGVYQGNNCQLFVGVYQENSCLLVFIKETYVYM